MDGKTLNQVTNKPVEKRTRLNAAVRHKQLVNIAISVSANKGLGQARHAEIADIAGVAISTVFFYFPTVNDLNNAIIDEIEEMLQTVSIENLLDEIDADDPVAVIDKQLELIEKTVGNINDYLVIYNQWSCSPNNPLWPRYLKARDKQIEVSKKFLKKASKTLSSQADCDLEPTAIIFAHLHKLLLTMKWSGEHEEVIRQTQNLIRDLLL